jgi:hypothetical protein
MDDEAGQTRADIPKDERVMLRARPRRLEPEEQVLLVRNVEVARELLDVGVADVGFDDPEAVKRESGVGDGEV